MAKTKISEYSSTSAGADLNTDIASINIDEGCSPANINNAIRALMAQVKDLQSGASGDTIPVTAGGTGSANASSARSALSAAKSGANSDITSITGLTTPLSVAQGGTGVATIPANGVVLGNGTGDVLTVAPGTSGNLLTSNGTTWTSAAPAGAIGDGQTWQNLTGSRVAGTTYTNSTGKPIMVNVTTYKTGSTPASICYVDSVQVAYMDGTGTNDVGIHSTSSFIVPNGST